VALFAFDYSLVKLLNYGMMFWLPYYVQNHVGLSGETSAALASSYDLVGILGSICAGYLTDWAGSRVLIVVPFLILSLPVFLLFRVGSSDSYWIYFILVPLAGFLVNGAANMISSAVAADLAQNEQVASDDETLSTVTGIIDGTGSLGAGLGQLAIGLLADISWDLAFVFLVIVGVGGIAMLWPLMRKEYKAWRIRKNIRRESMEAKESVFI